MLTLAIPFYRNLDYLRLTINSVREQSTPNWRLIVSDDGCVEPGVRELVESFGDERLTYAPSETSLGMVQNWNRCLELSQTDLVTLLHADDELSPNYVETMLAAADQHPSAAAFFCRAQIIDGKGRDVFSMPDYVKRFLEPSLSPYAELKGEKAILQLIRGNFIFCPSVCYRKSVLEERRFNPSWKMVQDLEFTTRLLFDGKSIIGLPERAYRYRRHGENASETYTKSQLRFEEEMALMQQLAQKAAQFGYQRVSRAARQANIIKLHLLYRSMIDVSGLRFQSAYRQLCMVHKLFIQN